MREEVASVVYPVFTYGIRLKKRLDDDDEALDFATAQKELQGLLQSVSQGGGRWSGAANSTASLSARPADRYLGIRYALVCWLDEVFILNSRWKDQWNERILEVEFYGHRDRAWKFWEQAELAAAQSNTDDLEVYFLCIMLGFEGNKHGAPEELKKLSERIKAQIDQGQGAEFNLPVEGQPRTYVPPLTGARRWHNMLAAGVIALLLVIMPLAFWLVLLGNAK